MNDKLKSVDKQLEALATTAGIGSDQGAQIDGLIDQLQPQVVVDNPRLALTVGEKLTEIARRLEYRRGEANGLLLTGFSHYMLSNHESALPLLMDAVKIFEAMGDEEGLARALGNVAGVYVSLGDFEQAIAYGFRALKLIRKVGNKTMEAWNLHGIGTGYFDLVSQTITGGVSSTTALEDSTEAAQF